MLWEKIPGAIVKLLVPLRLAPAKEPNSAFWRTGSANRQLARPSTRMSNVGRGFRVAYAAVVLTAATIAVPLAHAPVFHAC
jgi:hypothetical protein